MLVGLELRRFYEVVGVCLPTGSTAAAIVSFQGDKGLRYEIPRARSFSLTAFPILHIPALVLKLSTQTTACAILTATL